MYHLMYDERYFYIITEAAMFGDLAKQVLTRIKNGQSHMSELSVQYLAK